MNTQPADMHILDGKKHIHFIGIGGSGMYPLAQILHQKGYYLTGSDNNETDTLKAVREMGINVCPLGQRAENIEGADLIVHTAAIMADNPELIAAKASGVPVLERSELLGIVTGWYSDAICVSGTHGKTTATSMITQIMVEQGLDITAYIGGKLPLIHGSGKVGTNDTMVCESCEFVDTFLKLYPDTAVILNIDEDHLDFYKDIHEIEDTFAKFLGQIVPGGMAVLCGDDVRALSMKQRISVRSVTYGLDNPDCDYTARDITHDDAMCFSFTPVEHGVELPRVTLRVPGRHNALNALGVTAAARELGLTGEEIARGLDAFAGAHRRFELTATIEGVKLYHDYGHNPAEFHSVIPLADAVAGDHRLFVVCQPHTYSRTKLLFDQYMTCFTGADEVLITDIYAAREKDPGDIHATMLVDALQKHGVPTVYTPDFDACENYLRTHWQPGDVMISLGCGNINLLNEQIARHEAEKTN